MEELGRTNMKDLRLIEPWSNGGETETGLPLDLYTFCHP